jgi:hypothetical protein
MLPEEMKIFKAGKLPNLNVGLNDQPKYQSEIRLFETACKNILQINIFHNFSCRPMIARLKSYFL